jgi:hypothetical protein
MAFASMPCNLDHTLADAMKVVGAFRISGQVMHKIGSTKNKASGFSQIYLYEPKHAGNHSKQRHHDKLC